MRNGPAASLPAFRIFTLTLRLASTVPIGVTVSMTRSARRGAPARTVNGMQDFVIRLVGFRDRAVRIDARADRIGAGRQRRRSDSGDIVRGFARLQARAVRLAPSGEVRDRRLPGAFVQTHIHRRRRCRRCAARISYRCRERKIRPGGCFRRSGFQPSDNKIGLHCGCRASAHRKKRAGPKRQAYNSPHEGPRNATREVCTLRRRRVKRNEFLQSAGVNRAAARANLLPFQRGRRWLVRRLWLFSASE